MPKLVVMRLVMPKKQMDTIERSCKIFGKGSECVIKFVTSCEASIGAPHIEKESLETVRCVMLMKARPNSPTHLIMVLSLLSPTREMLLIF